MMTHDKRDGSCKHWLHLDMKGLMPNESHMATWIRWIAKQGYDGVVLEYEDRLPWQTWPDTFRAGFDMAAWQRLWELMHQQGLAIIPLIQTYGHLEWLLKHDRYAHLRCAGHINLIHPDHPEIRDLLSQWIDEVVGLHPQSSHIHVGLDEVYKLGAHQPEASEAEQLQSFIDHVSFVTNLVIKHGKTPIIWGDMFIAPSRRHGVEQLPPEVVLCDWKYATKFKSDLPNFSQAGERKVMGASAVRSNYSTHLLMADIDARLTNIQSWHALMAESSVPVDALIHTTWSRGRSLSPAYGPWEGWLPAFELAPNPGHISSPPMQEGLSILRRGMKTHDYDVVEQARKEMDALHSGDAFEEQALRWWGITLRHHELVMVTQYRSVGFESLNASMKHLGTDLLLSEEARVGRANLAVDLDALEKTIRQYMTSYLSAELDEFIDSRIGNLRYVARL